MFLLARMASIKWIGDIFGIKENNLFLVNAAIPEFREKLSVGNDQRRVEISGGEHQ
jgi:hypothetical protein